MSKQWAIYTYNGQGNFTFNPISAEEAALLVLSGEYYRDNIYGCGLTGCPCSKYEGTIRRVGECYPNAS